MLHMLILRVKLMDFMMLLTKFIKALRLPSTHIRSSLSSSKLSMVSALRQDEHLAAWARLLPQAVCQQQHLLSLGVKQLLGEKSTHSTNEESPSHTEEEIADMDTDKAVEKEYEKETTEEVPTRSTRAVLISIQPKSPPVAPKADKWKGIATDRTEEPTKKLVPASKEVRQDPYEPTRVPYEIHGKIYQLTNDEIQAHLDKEEMIKKAVREARLLAMSKPELIKVVHEEASNVGINPKVLASAKGGQEFKLI
ncbi:hypothetical protein Tco_0074007 [Tanacetum coccineum]